MPDELEKLDWELLEAGLEHLADSEDYYDNAAIGLMVALISSVLSSLVSTIACIPSKTAPD